MGEDKKKFDASFTAGGLFFREFTVLGSILIEDDFLEQLQREKELNLVIGISTESARKRIILELSRRYKMVAIDFWTWFLTIPQKEQKLALFYICLKTYPIVLDLQTEVALKKFRTGDRLKAFSVKMRLDELASIDDEVGSWSDSTLDKINSQYRSTLKDCGLLENDLLNYPAGISESFWDYFDDINESWFKETCFK